MSDSSDSRSILATVRRISQRGAAAVAFSLMLAAAYPAGAAIYTYENTTTGAFTDPGANNAGNCPSTGAAVQDRTFVVGDTFNVTSIAVGLDLTHGRRGDVRAELFSPLSATPFVLITGTSGAGGDADTNYDVMISSFNDADGGTVLIDDNSTDPTADPFYSRLVRSATIDAYYTGNAAGTWTLRVCDIRANDTFVGNFLRARLVLSDSQVLAANGETCTSKVTLDWSTFTDSAAFPGAGVVVTPGVTLTLASTLDVTGDAVDVGTYASSFESQTDQLGGINGMYYTGMDLETGELETALMRSVWNFSAPVHGLVWSGIDVDWGNDTSDFEDYWRTLGYTGAAGAGTSVPFIQTLQASHNVAGDIIEGDTEVPHASPALSGANVSRRFLRPVSSIVNDYMAGDAFADPGIQYESIGDASFCAFDYGDAPSSFGTLLAGGARHMLRDRELWMGTNRPDGEADGQVSSGANSDDTTMIGGLDDEDGVGIFPPCPATTTYAVTVSASDVRAAGTNGQIRGFIDWNRDGDFLDASEVSAATTVPRTNPDPSPYVVNWTGVAADCGGVGAAFARFRFSSDTVAIASPVGQASDGEVEDYTNSSLTLPVTIAYVETTPRSGSTTVRFTTATETTNAGFRIWSSGGRGARTLLASVKSQGSDSFVPQRYEVVVAKGAFPAIEIEDVDLFGRNRLHGPFALGTTFGEEPEADVIEWAAIRRDSGVVTALDRMAAAAAEERNAALAMESSRISRAAAGGLLLTREEGIHRVTFQELHAGGVDLRDVQASRIALIDNGVGVPRHIESRTGLFGPGDYVEFVARPQLTLASPVDAYVLTIDARRAIAAEPEATGIGATASTASLDRHRPDRVYSFASPNGDPWFDAQLLAWGGAASTQRTFDLPDLLPGEVRLKVRLWGFGDFDGAAPDHHVVLKLNGTEIAQRAFDGLTAWEPEIDISALAEAEGNELEIVVPGDTGYSFDNIAFEGFDVAYTRATLARDGRFSGAVNRRAFSIGGFPGAPVAVWKTKGAAMTRRLVQPEGGVVHAAGGTGTVYASAQNQLLHPGIVPGIPMAQRASSAEYLIVTHPSLMPAIGDLVELEESRGFTTEVVTTDRIFAAYSDHASSAVALKSFLSASLAQGNLRYVLLVGADTSDPHDHLGLGSVSLVPTDYRSFIPIIVYSPTDESLVDRANDGLGDVPIGRLPVHTPAELEAVVAKLYDWEAAVGAEQPSALLSAGLSDGERTIASVNESYAQSLPGWNTVLAQVDDAGPVVVRQQILDAVNSGAHLVSYVGHSSIGQWDFTPLLKWQDVAALDNAGMPVLFTSWGCWNGYYVEPNVESLSARLLSQPDAGAAGVIGATTLTSESSHRLLGTRFFARVNAGAATVGEAFHGAKQDLAATGGAADAIYGMTLLGDPAMSLPQP